jgi:hypothetical protein
MRYFSAEIYGLKNDTKIGWQPKFLVSNDCQMIEYLFSMFGVSAHRVTGSQTVAKRSP